MNPIVKESIGATGLVLLLLIIVFGIILLIGYCEIRKYRKDAHDYNRELTNEQRIVKGYVEYTSMRFLGDFIKSFKYVCWGALWLLGFWIGYLGLFCRNRIDFNPILLAVSFIIYLIVTIVAFWVWMNFKMNRKTGREKKRSIRIIKKIRRKTSDQ